eukprot:2689730-Rhodomonas_salina.1
MSDGERADLGEGLGVALLALGQRLLLRAHRVTPRVRLVHTVSHRMLAVAGSKRSKPAERLREKDLVGVVEQVALGAFSSQLLLQPKLCLPPRLHRGVV